MVFLGVVLPHISWDLADLEALTVTTLEVFELISISYHHLSKEICGIAARVLTDPAYLRSGTRSIYRELRTNVGHHELLASRDTDFT